MSRVRVTERQRYIDRVFIAALTGLGGQNPQTYSVEAAYNLAEYAWDLREQRRAGSARRKAE